MAFLKKQLLRFCLWIVKGLGRGPSEPIPPDLTDPDEEYNTEH